MAEKPRLVGAPANVARARPLFPTPSPLPNEAKKVGSPLAFLSTNVPFPLTAAFAGWVKEAVRTTVPSLTITMAIAYVGAAVLLHPFRQTGLRTRPGFTSVQTAMAG